MVNTKASRAREHVLDRLRRARNIADQALTVGVHRFSSNVGSAGQHPTLRSDPRGIDVILPAAAGSYGDEGLAHGTIAGLRNAERGRTMWIPSIEDHWITGAVGSEKLSALKELRIGNTALVPAPAKERWSSRPVYVIGADTIGGDYLHGFLGFRTRSLAMSSNAGHQARLVNFSFGRHPSRTAVELLRSLPNDVELWARDIHSQHRAQESLQRTVQAAPDVAALMEPRATEATEQFLEPLETPFVVLVPNAHFLTMGWQTEEQVLDAWVATASACAEAGYALALVPHDVRPRPGDPALAQRIGELLDSQGLRASIFVPESAPEAKRVIAQAAGVVSARMHGCVAALSKGIPAVGIEYLDKFGGQFAWYEGLGEVLPMNEAGSGGAALIQLIANTGGRTNRQQIGWQDLGWLRQDESDPIKSHSAG